MFVSPDILSDAPATPANRRERRAFRAGALFIADCRAFYRRLDRNQKAKIMALAEALERRTKPKGHRNGVVSVVGLAVLRALLFRFLNSGTGRLDPSYDALKKHTGHCRQAIRNALARLEQCGILTITRRLVRQYITRQSPITGERETILATTQATNLYAVHEPGAWADHLERPAGKTVPFPSKRMMGLLESMQLTWRTKLSLRDREELHTPVHKMIGPSVLNGPRGSAGGRTGVGSAPPTTQAPAERSRQPQTSDGARLTAALARYAATREARGIPAAPECGVAA